jgi:predicted Rossmann fold flavoprotein
VNKVKIAIIGGGASGLFAAAMLNDSNASVTIFEKNNKLGKKILASGNGKCNFSNVGTIENKYNNQFANNIIDKFNVEETLREFSNMGLIYKHDDQGRCYPVSECASSVLDCLKGRLNNSIIKLESVVKFVDYDGEKCIVEYNDKREIFDYVICCSGSCASNLGSENAYNYLQKLDIKIEDVKSSLSPIIVKEKVRELSGVRVKCIVKLINYNGDIDYCEKGEVIFKDDGLSGIAIFNASSYMNRNKNNKYKLVLDISNGLDEQFIKNYLNGKKVDNIFTGFLHDKIAKYILSKYKLANDLNLDETIVNKLVKEIKGMEFDVVGLYPIKDAQVCSGGVSIFCVDDNLKLKKYSKIYVAGELLDVDGICGGYNLQFAWSSAGVIVRDIKKRICE